MIAATVYALVFAGFILYNRFFGLFNDRQFPKRELAALWLIKALAVPVFFLVHEKYYGGIENLDTGKFFNDAQVLNDCAKNHPAVFLKIFLGSDERKLDHDCLDRTLNWKEGRTRKFFYNDNRLLIRAHTLLHFIAYGSWFAHALFSCFLSYVGLFYFFRAFVPYLGQGRRLLLWVLCLIPSLWLFTGALMKEGLTVFVLGLACCQARSVLLSVAGKRGKAALLLLLALCCLLKPFFLLPAVFAYALFVLLKERARGNAALVYVILFLSTIGLLNFVSMALSGGEGITSRITAQQRAFRGTSQGGIFLSGDTTFVQLRYDTSLIESVEGSNDLYTIRKNASYMYWEDSHNQDTLYCRANLDTTSRYELAFMTPASASNYTLPPLQTHPAKAMLKAWYYSLFFPLFVNADSGVRLLASAENLLVLVSLLLVSACVLLGKGEHLLPVACLCFFLLYALLLGLTSPNSGAILRYRSLPLVFLATATVYCTTIIPRIAGRKQNRPRSQAG